MRHRGVVGKVEFLGDEYKRNPISKRPFIRSNLRHKLPAWKSKSKRSGNAKKTKENLSPFYRDKVPAPTRAGARDGAHAHSKGTVAEALHHPFLPRASNRVES